MEQLGLTKHMLQTLHIKVLNALMQEYVIENLEIVNALLGSREMHVNEVSAQSHFLHFICIIFVNL